MAHPTPILYEDIIVDPSAFPNSRRDYKDLEQLSGNIEKFGLLEAITVWVTDNGYILADGIRRYAAIELLRERNPARWDDLFGDGIECKTLHCDEDHAIDVSILININRESYNQAEEADAFALLRARGRSTKEVHKLTGRSVRHINRLLKFKDEAEPETFDAVARGEISFAAAKTIARRAAAEQAGAVKKMKDEVAKDPKERDVTEMKTEMTKLANQEQERVAPEPKRGRGRQPGPKKPPRPRVTAVRDELIRETEDQEALIAQYKDRPKEAKDLDEHPSHAGHVVHFQYQMGWAEGARAALEWSLGDREDIS